MARSSKQVSNQSTSPESESDQSVKRSSRSSSVLSEARSHVSEDNAPSENQVSHDEVTDKSEQHVTDDEDEPSEEKQSAQLRSVLTYLRKANKLDKLSRLPSSKDMVFADVGNNEFTRKNKLYHRKLFLGGNTSCGQIWAYLKVHTAKASQVIISVAPLDGDPDELSTVIHQDQWEGAELMYPFRMIADRHWTSHSRRVLNTWIQWYFLESGETEKAWVGGEGVAAMERLGTAINVVTNAYQRYPGGFMAVPKPFSPEYLADQTLVEQAHVTEVTPGPKKWSARNVKELGKARQVHINALEDVVIHAMDQFASVADRGHWKPNNKRKADDADLDGAITLHGHDGITNPRGKRMKRFYDGYKALLELREEHSNKIKKTNFSKVDKHAITKTAKSHAQVEEVGEDKE